MSIVSTRSIGLAGYVRICNDGDDDDGGGGGGGGDGGGDDEIH